jgi:hypothetical protein
VLRLLKGGSLCNSTPKGKRPYFTGSHSGMKAIVETVLKNYKKKDKIKKDIVKTSKKRS